MPEHRHAPEDWSGGTFPHKIPETANGILRIRILCTASNAGDNAIASLLQELNQTHTIFPGTSLRMVYELPGNTADPDLSGSNM